MGVKVRTNSVALDLPPAYHTNQLDWGGELAMAPRASPPIMPSLIIPPTSPHTA